MKKEDIEVIRKSVGCSAVITDSNGEMVYDDDVDNISPDAGVATLAILIAEASGKIALADAEYRAWRGTMASSILARDPKMAEWKVRAEIEADPGFLAMKAKIAELEEIREALNGFKAALVIR